MTDKQETLAEVIEDMRGYAEAGQYLLDHYADRIESAGKRAEENHKQELDRAVLNRDFLDVMKFCAEEMNQETATNCNRLGDASKLREALEKIIDILNNCAIEHYWDSKMLDICRAALTAPPRNCDRFATGNDVMREWLAKPSYVTNRLEDGADIEEMLDWLLSPVAPAAQEGGRHADA